MKPYGYGMNEVNKNTEQYCINRRPWVVVPLFYGESEE